MSLQQAENQDVKALSHIIQQMMKSYNDERLKAAVDLVLFFMLVDLVSQTENVSAKTLTKMSSMFSLMCLLLMLLT